MQELELVYMTPMDHWGEVTCNVSRIILVTSIENDTMQDIEDEENIPQRVHSPQTCNIQEEGTCVANVDAKELKAIILVYI